MGYKKQIKAGSKSFLQVRNMQVLPKFIFAIFPSVWATLFYTFNGLV